MNFLKTTMPMTGVTSGAVIPKDKTKSNTLPRQKVRILSESFFPSAIKWKEFSLPKGYQHQSMEVK